MALGQVIGEAAETLSLRFWRLGLDEAKPSLACAGAVLGEWGGYKASGSPLQSSCL